MNESFDRWRPIYIQIIDEIRKKIARRDLHPGEKLPSQRDLALDYGVNPNTVQRVYREMETMGIVETKRGQGTFVVEERSLPERLQHELAREYLEEFMVKMRDLGLGEEVVRTLVESFIGRE